MKSHFIRSSFNVSGINRSFGKTQRFEKLSKINLFHWAKVTPENLIFLGLYHDIPTLPQRHWNLELATA